MKTPPAPSEDLLFSPPSQEPARAQPAPTQQPPQHASSSGSGMSDERNADSVLFKLDTLTAMQAGPSAAASAAEGGAPEAMARLAAPAPSSDAGSGLIDLSTLGGAAQPDAQTSHASSSGSDVTSSAALSQSSLLSSSGISRVVPPAHGTPLPAAPSRTPLLILSVLALLALVAAVSAIVLRG